MKERLKKYWPRAAAFGLVMTLVRCLMGGLRFGAPGLPPVWVQLLRFFVVYGGVLLAVLLGADRLRRRFRSDREKE